MNKKINNFFHLIFNPLKNTFDYKNRATRVEFFVPFVIYGLLIYGLALLNGRFAQSFLKPELIETYINGSSWVLVFIFLVIFLSLSARRLHDANLSFGYYFLIIISGWLNERAISIESTAQSFALFCEILSFLAILYYFYLLALPTHKGKGFNFNLNRRYKKISKWFYWRVPILIIIGYAIIGALAFDATNLPFVIGRSIGEVSLIFIFFYFVQKAENFDDFQSKQFYFIPLFGFLLFTSFVEFQKSSLKEVEDFKGQEKSEKSVDDFFKEKDEIVKKEVPNEIPKKRPSEKNEPYILNKDEVNKYITEKYDIFLDDHNPLISKVGAASNFLNEENNLDPTFVTSSTKLDFYLDSLPKLIKTTKNYKKEFLSLLDQHVKDVMNKYGNEAAKEFKRTFHIKYFEKAIETKIAYYNKLIDFYKFMKYGVVNSGFYYDSNQKLIIIPTDRDIAIYDQHIETLVNYFQESDKAMVAFQEIIEKEKFNIDNVPSKYDSKDDKIINPNDYKSVISQMIAKNKIYPQKAQLNSIEGDVKVKFKIDKEGNLIDIEIIESSGNNLLDDAAVSAIKKTAPFPKPPKELIGSHAGLSLTIPFDFNLK